MEGARVIASVNQSEGLREHLIDDWLVERHGRFRVWCKREAKGLKLLARIAGDPERLLAEGEFLNSSRQDPRTDKFRVHLNDDSYFCKRYNRRGLIYALKNTCRKSRAHKSLLAAQRFKKAGVPTPEPLLCLEERHYGLLGRAYLFFPYVSGGSANFLELWPLLNETQRRDCLVALGDVIGRMHRHGLLHGDLNWRNIIATMNQDHFRFWLVDLDGSRLLRVLDLSRAQRDLAHFQRDMDRNDVVSALQQEFMTVWKEVVTAE